MTRVWLDQRVVHTLLLEPRQQEVAELVGRHVVLA